MPERIPTHFYGIEIVRMSDTNDGRMRVRLFGKDTGYEQEFGESDEDFVFVVERMCLKERKHIQAEEESLRITREKLEAVANPKEKPVPIKVKVKLFDSVSIVIFAISIIVFIVLLAMTQEKSHDSNKPSKRETSSPPEQQNKVR